MSDEKYNPYTSLRRKLACFLGGYAMFVAAYAYVHHDDAERPALERQPGSYQIATTENTPPVISRQQELQPQRPSRQGTDPMEGIAALSIVLAFGLEVMSARQRRILGPDGKPLTGEHDHLPVKFDFDNRFEDIARNFRTIDGVE